MCSVAEKEDNPIVSIIVAVYNVGAYLEQCVQSVLDQTERKIEVILVDDGSTDDSGGICDRFAREDARVRVLHQANGGVSVARNNAMACARGEWIMFVDGDDWLPPDSVEILLTAIAGEQDCDIVAGAHCMNFPDHETFEGGEENRGVRNVFALGGCRQEIVEYVMEGIWFPGLSEISCDLNGPCAKLYRRALLEEHEIRYVPRQVKSEDHIFNLYAVQNARKLVVINLPVYHYRIWDGSFSQQFVRNRVSLEAVAFWKREVERFVKTYGYSDELVAYFSFHRAKQMTRIWIDSFLAREMTWRELKEHVGSLKAKGFPVDIRNRYYSKVHLVYAVALKYNLCGILLAARWLIRRIWG